MEVINVERQVNEITHVVRQIWPLVPGKSVSLTNVQFILASGIALAIYSVYHHELESMVLRNQSRLMSGGRFPTEKQHKPYDRCLPSCQSLYH